MDFLVLHSSDDEVHQQPEPRNRLLGLIPPNRPIVPWGFNLPHELLFLAPLIKIDPIKSIVMVLFIIETAYDS